jgi:hypothetical protein
VRMNSYFCTFCQTQCKQRSDWNRHLSRPKHVRNEQMATETRTDVRRHFECSNCSKSFRSRGGLWKHRKTCNNSIYDAIRDKDALVMHLLKQNGDLHEKIMAMANQPPPVTVHNNTNSHNNTTFNLSFFLNETCKNAMNITDFVSSIVFNLEDLEHTGKRGYIEGISHIILKNLNNLETHIRPLHCSDHKREVMYIKDNNEWQRESEQKPILRKTIKDIACENMKQIGKWTEKHPGCRLPHSTKNDLFLKIVSNSMNGSTEHETEHNINKIIGNIAKKVTINKELV